MIGAAVRPDRYVVGGVSFWRPSRWTKFFVTPEIEMGESKNFYLECGCLWSSYKAPDKCVGFDLFLREHREPAVENGPLEMWTSEYHWRFEDVTWEPVTGGRWGGLRGQASPSYLLEKLR